ncbi:MAG: ANL family adenylate-forming protein [Pseudohaliea sp.]
MSAFFFEALARGGDGPAVLAGDQVTTHRALQDAMLAAEEWLAAQGLPPGSVVSFDGDYSAPAIALFLALTRAGAITVPISADARPQADSFREIAEVEYRVDIEEDGYRLHATGREACHPLYADLRGRSAAGLVLFSSGSTGQSKAIVQDMGRLLGKFRRPGKAQRMLIFLQLDHIGGVNSLLYALANGGTLVLAPDRAPETVAATIARHRVELLPTSPTFLNLLLLSGAHERHDLSSLKLVTYGTEPMQASTLAALHATLPAVKLQQTYGLSEVGILRSRSKDSGSLWMQVGGDEFETRIRGGTLWIRSESAMLGYLNAPSPFDADGFMDTGDVVEQERDWLRVLGRSNDLINVGGSKVYPAEVESVLLELEGVRDVVVYGEPHPLTGAVVAARFELDAQEEPAALKARVRRHCRDRLPAWKIPARITVSEGALYGARYKRLRRAPAGAAAENATAPGQESC